MSEQYVPNLGHEPAPDARRDAVHVAVAPVVAACPIRVGSHVRLTEDGTDRAVWGTPEDKDTIGIADPFLPPGAVINRGQRFWLFLYPGTITSLRHQWTHPAFKVKIPQKVQDLVNEREET